MRKDTLCELKAVCETNTLCEQTPGEMGTRGGMAIQDSRPSFHMYFSNYGHLPCLYSVIAVVHTVLS